MKYILVLKISAVLYGLYLVVKYYFSIATLKKYKRSMVHLESNEIRYFRKFQKKLKFAGYLLENEIIFLIIMRYFIPVLVFILIYIINFPDVRYSFFVIILYFVVFNLHLHKKINERNRTIEFNGYKIFKFLLNQISSGILVTDAIKSMYMIVSDSKLKSCLIDVSAYYTQTTDIINALEILKEQYRGVEVDTLCVAIQQGINTGRNHETMRRMEALLFKKYIYHIKRETDAKQHKSFLAVLLLCLIIILMISIPIVIDILNAFNQIFI